LAKGQTGERERLEKQKVKKVFICQGCGRESPKWEGRCSGCQEWNCLVETTVAKGKSATESRPDAAGHLLELAKLKHDSYSRITFPIGELNRVLGGGLVRWCSSAVIPA
jgi:DNA repair protein RadA/Sms